METATKEIIKEKVYENGHHDCNDRKARNGFGMGLAGVITGGLALLNQWGGNGRGLFGIGGGNTPDNININTLGGSSSSSVPTAFQSWEKACDATLNLTNEMWAMKANTLNQMYAHRETDVSEKFGLYKATRDLYDVMNDKVNNSSFGLYKSQRDLYDTLNERYANKFCELDKKVAVMEAIRPYQDKLLQEEIKSAYIASINHADRLDCRNIKGVVTLPSTPTITGLQSQRCCCNNQATQTQG